jgi:hypothetical protein
MKFRSCLLIVTVLMACIGCRASSSPAPAPLAPTPTAPGVEEDAVQPLVPTPTAPGVEEDAVQPTAPQPAPGSAEPTATPLAGALALVSQQSLFTFLEDLTAIQPYSGWRNSGTEGEQEALDYVSKKLGEMEHLGLELERQDFRVFLAIELWDTRLYLKLGEHEIEVPAASPRGYPDNIAQALRFDSDGSLNDRQRNPSVAEGRLILIRSVEEIEGCEPGSMEGKLVFVDYAAVDGVLVGDEQAGRTISQVLEKRPAGLVLVTSFSNQQWVSHGTHVGDGSLFYWLEKEYAPPTLYVRLEDLAPAGIETWEDLARVDSARMSVDADVFSPGTSSNLVARIPGADVSKAVILGAHIDSPNCPGALDDGSGSVLLLEVARVLNAARVQPPTDVYLVWFGSEEIGLYGSYHFAATHQELLDRTLAMLQIDALSHPLDGLQGRLELVTWSYGRLGDGRLTWPNYLAGRMDRHGVKLYPKDSYMIWSDNSAFTGFGVPNANLICKNDQQMQRFGTVHYPTHMHDPYDTIELVREMGDVFEQMARTALVAALETGQDAPDLRVAPSPEQRVVFVASHTEAIHMAPTTFTDIGMLFGLNGFDVDMVPYGQPVSPADMEAELVVVLPVVDYASPDGDVDLYDEAWGQEEVAAMEAYVAGGGLLVLTNSAHRLKYSQWVLDPNEDWADANALAERFGGVVPGRDASHRLYRPDT